MDTEEAVRSLQAAELITEARWHAFDLLLVEVLVALEARGVLSRREIMQALVRAETRANLPEGDEERGFVEEAAGSYIELVTGFAVDRLGAAPELAVLKRDIAEWEKAGGVGPHPCEPTRRRRRP